MYQKLFKSSPIWSHCSCLNSDLQRYQGRRRRPVQDRAGRCSRRLPGDPSEDKHGPHSSWLWRHRKGLCSQRLGSHDRRRTISAHPSGTYYQRRPGGGLVSHGQIVGSAVGRVIGNIREYSLIGGSITTWLTFCLTGLVLTQQVNVLLFYIIKAAWVVQ